MAKFLPTLFFYRNETNRNHGDRRRPRRFESEADFAVRISPRVREELDVSSGYKIRWSVTDDGELEIKVVEQEYGVFDDAETVSLGGGADEHDCMGLEH